MDAVTGQGLASLSEVLAAALSQRIANGSGPTLRSLKQLGREDPENKSRARADNSAEGLCVLRDWTYNLLKADTSLKGSFSDKQFKCLLNENFLNKILAVAYCS